MKKSPLVILFIAVFLDLLGFGIVLPLMPFYVLHFDGTAFQLGMLLAVYSLMQLIFSPLWGRLSDRIGRRPVLMISFVGSAISLIAFGLANTLWLLFLSRALHGISSATISVAQAYIADSTTLENRAKGMGIIGAAFGLGFVFGPAIGGILAQFGHGVPAFFAAGISLINLIFAYFKLPESYTPSESGVSNAKQPFSFHRIFSAYRLPSMQLLLSLVFFNIFAFATMESTFSLLTYHNFGYKELENGYIFTYLGLMVAALQGGLVGKLVKRFGERSLVLAGFFFMAIGLGTMSFAHPVSLFLVTLIPLAIGNGLVNPCLSALVSQHSPSDKQGEILGVSQSMSSLGRILGPLWGGFSFHYMGSNAPYLIAASVMAMMALFSIQLLKLSTPQSQPSSR